MKLLLSILMCVSISNISFGSGEKKLRVGVLYWSMNIEGQVAMRKGLEEEHRLINKHAREQGTLEVELIPRVAGDGSDGIENQIKQMYEVIKLRPDAIILQPTDNAALSKPVQLANKLNIPVVAYDQYVSGARLASYITSNNYQAGYLDGEYIASLFDENYAIRIVLVEYPHVSSTVERVDGFIDALKACKQKFKILKTYRAVEPVSGRQAGKDILRDFPKKGTIDVVFTVNDGGGLSVVDELAKKDRFEIKVATIDGDQLSVENIKNRRLTVIDSAQFCGELGRESMKATYKILMGHNVPQKILVPTFPITLETLNQYPGWLGHIPESFPKPWDKKMWNNKLNSKP